MHIKVVMYWRGSRGGPMEGPIKPRKGGPPSPLCGAGGPTGVDRPGEIWGQKIELVGPGQSGMVQETFW